jgi:hypothetical protein
MTIPDLSQFGSIPPGISNLGTDAVAQFQAGFNSLSTGVANFSKTTLTSIGDATGISSTQLSGLATGLTGGDAAAATQAITTAVQGDVGALLANGSKFGTSLTSAWAAGSNALSSLSSANLPDLASTGLTNLQDAATGALSNAEGLASGALSNAEGLASGALSNAEGLAKNALAGPAGAAMDALGKASQFAASFSDQLSGLVSGVQKAATFTNTVDRKTVDAAVSRVIGSDKIAPPTFELPSIESLGISADISQAKNLLAQAQSAGSDLISQAQGAVSAVQGAIGSVQGIANQLPGQAISAAKNLFIK